MMARQMKDSGVEWIGEMPEEWNILPLGNCFEERNEKVSDYDWEPLSVTKLGIVKQLETAAKSDAHDARKKVCKGDFVINSRSDRKQSCGISIYDGSVSLINIVLSSRLLNTAYVKYLLKNYGFAEEFYRWGTGIVADLWSTKYERMKKIMLPIPNGCEQQKIADFLDEKVGEIDSVISKTKETIEDYKKYKQAIITETVTKGLNPDVEMKDSKLQWVDEIPKHWKKQKILHIISIPVIDGPHVSPELVDEGVPYISADAIENGKINFDRKRGYISKEYSEECNKRYKPQKDDILVVKLGASTGKMGIVGDDTYFNIWVPLAVVRCKDDIIPKYIFYSMESIYFKNEIKNGWTFGTQETLGVKTLEQLKVFVPPFDEQNKIAFYLDEKCSEIDKLIAKKEELLKDLESYKKSLIYEYVTGKKEV